MLQFNLLESHPDSPGFSNSDEATANTLRFILPTPNDERLIKALSLPHNIKISVIAKEWHRMP